MAAFNLGTGRFSAFQSARDDVEATTTSTTYQQKLTKSWTVGTAGNWLVLCTWRLTGTSTSYSAEARMQLDNATTDCNPLRRIQNTGDYLETGGIDVRNLAAGTRTFDVDYRSKSTSGTAKIKNCPLRRAAAVSLWLIWACDSGRVRHCAGPGLFFARPAFCP